MGNAEDYQLKLPEITAITDEMLSGPLRIPVDIYVQEAMDLFKWCQADKEPLVAKGLDWKIVDDIPVRAGALREAESRWITQRFTKQETGKEWQVKSNEVFETRNFLLHEFRFAYRKDSYLLGRINSIAGSQSYAGIIQDLNDFSVLGKNNPEPLKAINFDMKKLDDAAALAAEVAALLAATKAEGDYSAEKKIRDQAFTYLKMAVDEVGQCGQYVFWKDEARKKGYRSSHLRRTRKKKGRPDENKDSDENNSITDVDNKDIDVKKDDTEA